MKKSSKNRKSTRRSGNAPAHIDQVGAVGTYIDPESLRAYREYLLEHRARLATYGPIQREIMGGGRRLAGESIS